MKRLEFETYEDFICEVTDKMDVIREFDEYGDIAIVAKYKEANVIIKELLRTGYDVASIYLGKEDFEEYYDEYIISIVNCDGNTEVWCMPFKHDDEYLIDESFIIYIMDNCSSACIPHCMGKVVVEVGIGNNECDCCECNNKLVIESDDNMHGFTVNRSDENGYSSCSFYSTNEKLVEEMARLFK